jgi:hypothetical protein
MAQEMGHGGPTPLRRFGDMSTFPQGGTLEARVLVSWEIG